MRVKPTNTPIIHSANQLCIVAPTCFGITLPSSGSVPSAHHATRHNTPIHNILSTAPQLNISPKAPETLPEDGNITPKHVGVTILN
jgi:hypothetical protein